MITNPLRRLPYPDAARGLLRTTVLTVVDELVRSDGWAATSLSAIARAAGVSRQTLYNEFGSRRSIAEAYIVHRLDGLLDMVAERVDGDDLADTLREAFARFFVLADEPLIQTALAADSVEVMALVRVTNERATTRLAEILRTVDPGLTDRDAQVYADAIARTAVTHVVAPTVGADEAIDRLTHLALALVTPRHAPVPAVRT